MLLRFTHETNLTYGDSITESVVELRMAPRQETDQHRLSFMLAVGPRAGVNSYFDWLGNMVHTFTVRAPHREVRMVATSIVETDRKQIDVTELGDTWPINRPMDYRMWEYLQFGGPIIDSPALRQMVERLQPREGIPLGELAMRMLDSIYNGLIYEQGVTTSECPITTTLELGKGVCQDFTHVMVGLARALKIPARYVSGLVHPETSDYRDVTQTHAWCELFFPTIGWIAFDPTNHCVVGPNFAKVAIGRDYRDVAPNRGVYRGTAKESMSVVVKSELLGAIPADLFAERYQSIQIAVPAVEPQKHFAIHSQHQEAQQQQ